MAKADKTKITQSVIGIDISGSVVNMAEIREDDRGIVIERFDSLEVPLTLDKESRVAQITGFLKDKLARTASKKQKIYSLVSGSEVIIRRISIPKMREKDLLEAIKWEIKGHIPFPIDSAVVNYSLLGEVRERGLEKLDLLVVAAQKESLDNTRMLFDNAGVKLEGISVAPFAIWTLLRKTSLLQKDKTTAFINIGAEATKIMVFNGDNLEFYRELPLAGNTFTKAMIGLFVSDKWQMNMDYVQAEKTKRLYGIPDEHSTEKSAEGVPLTQIYQVLRPTLRRFMNEVNRSFSYYKEQFRKNSIDRIFISGGSSKLKNIESYLASELEAKVEKLDEVIRFNRGAGIKDERALKDVLPHLVIVIGTALSQAKEMNFLRDARSGAKATKKFDLSAAFPSLPRIPSTANFYIVLSALLGTFFVAGFIALNIGLNNGISYYKAQITEKKAMLAQLKELSEQRAMLSQIEKSRTPLKQSLAELSNLMPPGTFLNTFSFANDSKGLQVLGQSSNMNLVGDLLKNLESSPFFSGSSLVEARRAFDKKTVDFKITFRSDL